MLEIQEWTFFFFGELLRINKNVIKHELQNNSSFATCQEWKNKKTEQVDNKVSVLV